MISNDNSALKYSQNLFLKYGSDFFYFYNLKKGDELWVMKKFTSYCNVSVVHVYVYKETIHIADKLTSMLIG